MNPRSFTLPASWPAFLKAAGKLPAMFTNRWWAGFSLGLLAAGLWSLLGTVLSSLHDQYWLPVLFHVLLSPVVRWTLTGLLMFFLLWRADVPSKFGVAVAMVSGAWLGVLLLYDVWYYYPFLIAVWAAFLAWRAGWMLWSYPGGGLIMAGVVGLVLTGAALSTSSPFWDNRFTLGRSGLGNFSATGILLCASGFASVAAAYFAVKGGLSPRPSRPPLIDLIEREPRMNRYLDAVLAVTGSKLRPGKTGPVRFVPTVGRLPKLRGESGTFGGSGATWGRSVLWNLAFVALKIPGVGLLLKLFRTPFTQPGMRCEALVRLLREGVGREHERWSTAHDESVMLNFARGVALREALIEVSLYFGRGAPVVDLVAEVERRQALLTPSARTPATAAAPVDPLWTHVAQEYEQLWFENCERLFLIRGDRFTLPLLRLEDVLDANAIRAALKTPTSATAWVVDQLKLSQRYQQLELNPADPDSDPGKMHIVAALNHLIENARPAQERSASVARLMERGTAPAASGSANRRADLIRMRESLARAFDSALAPVGDWVDFNQLSRSWLICRLAAGGAPSLHRAAADLALAVFVLDEESPSLAARLAEQLKESYLDLHGNSMRSPCRSAATPEDRAEAARCALLCALWQAHLGHWTHAGGPLTLGVIDFGDAHLPEPVLRVSAHLHAALRERQLRTATAGTTEAERGTEDVLRQFEALDNRETVPGLLFEERIPGHVLARSFAERILRPTR